MHEKRDKQKKQNLQYVLWLHRVMKSAALSIISCRCQSNENAFNLGMAYAKLRGVRIKVGMANAYIHQKDKSRSLCSYSNFHNIMISFYSFHTKLSNLAYRRGPMRVSFRHDCNTFSSFFEAVWVEYQHLNLMNNLPFYSSFS